MVTRQERFNELISQHFEGKQVRLSEKTGIAGAIISQYAKGRLLLSEKTMLRIEVAVNHPGWFAGADAGEVIAKPQKAEKKVKVAKEPKASKVVKVVVGKATSAKDAAVGALESLKTKKKSWAGDQIELLAGYLGITALASKVTDLEARLAKLENV